MLPNEARRLLSFGNNMKLQKLFTTAGLCHRCCLKYITDTIKSESGTFRMMCYILICTCLPFPRALLLMTNERYWRTTGSPMTPDGYRFSCVRSCQLFTEQPIADVRRTRQKLGGFGYTCICSIIHMFAFSHSKCPTVLLTTVNTLP